MQRNSLLEAFLADRRLQGLTESSLEAEKSRIGLWLHWCSEHEIEPATAPKSAFLAYLESRRSLKAETRKKDFCSLAALYSFLDESGQASLDIENIRKKYLRRYKPDASQRQLISIEDAARLVGLTLKTRDRAILLILLKTGIRMGELLSLDVSDIDGGSIRLKPAAKRSNRTVFLDHEAEEALRRWLKVRAQRTGPAGPLWLNTSNERLGETGIKKAMRAAGTRACLHDPSGPLERRFSAHCCRHWFTTHLLRAGMRREYVQWLRGDAIKEAVDIYFHIDPEDVRRAYLAHIPQLGI